VSKQDGRDVVEFAFSSLFIARIFGAEISIITRFHFVDAFSSILVAAINGTCVVIITIDLFEDTFSGFRIARVSGTCITIVTSDTSLNDTFSSSAVA